MKANIFQSASFSCDLRIAPTEKLEKERGDARSRCCYAAESNLKEWLVHLFHEWNNGLLNTLSSRTFQGVCWHYVALLTVQWRIVPLPRSSTFSLSLSLFGSGSIGRIEIGVEDNCCSFAIFERPKSNLACPPEILSLVISCQSFDFAPCVFSTLILYNYRYQRTIH